MTDAERDAEIEAYEFLRTRKRNYHLALGSIPGQEVLRDLAKFCFANDSTYSVHPHEQALNEGRRQVWLRIQLHLNLTPDHLYALGTGRNFNHVLKEENDDDNPTA